MVQKPVLGLAVVEHLHLTSPKVAAHVPLGFHNGPVALCTPTAPQRDPEEQEQRRQIPNRFHQPGRGTCAHLCHGTAAKQRKPLL